MELRIDVRGGGPGEAAFSALTDRWLDGPRKRREFLEPLRDQLEGSAPPLDEDELELAVGPATTALKQGMDGIELTATGTFSPDFAKRMAADHPRWALGTGPEAVNREADLPMLRNLRALLFDCGFLHRVGRVALTSENAVEMLEKSPTALLLALGCEILWDHGFASQAGELCAAALLLGEPLDSDRIAETVHPVLAEFCRMGDRPLDIEATRLAASLWTDLSASTGIVPDAYLEELRSSEGDGWPRPVGPLARACLVAVLRFRIIRRTVLTD